MKLPIKEVKSNASNPRIIKDDKFKKLVKSLKDFPEMADVRPLVINTDNVILGGNMRFKAMQSAGWTEVPVHIVDWSEEQQEEFIIKDNANFGEWDWDILANSWDAETLSAWGIDTPADWGADEAVAPNDLHEDESMMTIVVVAYNDINELDAITELYNLETIDIPKNVKEELASQRKVYVFKK